jgi:hypothetical protein
MLQGMASLLGATVALAVAVACGSGGGDRHQDRTDLVLCQAPAGEVLPANGIIWPPPAHVEQVSAAELSSGYVDAQGRHCAYLVLTILADGSALVVPPDEADQHTVYTGLPSVEDARAP